MPLCELKNLNIMKKDFLVFAAILTVLTLALSGCGKEFSAEENVDENVSEIVGSSNFYSSLSCLNCLTTKAGENSVEEIADAIQPLFVSAKEYLALNGYNYIEDFEENDPGIILTAYALLESDLVTQIPQTKVEVTTILSCVFFGERIDEVTKTAIMLLAKRYAKKSLCLKSK